MTSGVSQGSFWGPVLYIIFVNYMDSDIECSIIKLAGNTKLCSMVDLLEGGDGSRRILTGFRSGPVQTAWGSTSESSASELDQFQEQILGEEWG